MLQPQGAFITKLGAPGMCSTLSEKSPASFYGRAEVGVFNGKVITNSAGGRNSFSSTLLVVDKMLNFDRVYQLLIAKLVLGHKPHKTQWLKTRSI